MTVAIPTSLAVANGKGGVLKTSLVANLAGLSAAAGYRVLTVDLDPQGNLALDLGYSTRSDQGAGLLKALMFDDDAPVITRGVRHRLDCIAGGDRLNQWARLAAGQPGRADAAGGALQRVLLPLVDDYDLILLDVPPGNEELQMLAAVCSRHVVIPTQPDTASIGGVQRIAELFKQVETINPDLELLGVVLTRIGLGHTAVRRETREKVNRLFNITPSEETTPVLFDTIIREASAPAVGCRNEGLLAHEYELELDEQRPFYVDLREGTKTTRKAASGRGLAGDYSDLAAEILSRRAQALALLGATA